MKIALFIILLTILLYPSGCAVYDVKSVDREHNSNANENDNQEIHADRVEKFKNAVRDASFNENLQNGVQGDELIYGKILATKMIRDVVKASKCKIDNFVGTNLFDGTRKKCFSQEDVALLTARMDFEMLLPKDLLTENPICDELAVVMMQYFYESCHVIQRMTDESIRHMTEMAFYDALGGYLKSYMVPMVQYAFYAGQVSLKTTQSVISLYDQCKRFLNTNGNGWHGPMEQLTNALCNIPIEPLKIECKNGGSALCCSKLNLAADKGGCAGEGMLVPLPKLDPEDEDGFLTNINFPFKCKRIYNLRSEKSSFMIVKFFETVTRCYQFRGMSQNDYNLKFKNWIIEHIQMHLTDEQFYPGLGAILRVYENLGRNKKSVNLEKLNDNDNDDDDNDDDDYYLNNQLNLNNDYVFNINEDEDYFNEKNAIMMESMSNGLHDNNNDEEEANIEFDDYAIDDFGKYSRGNPKIKCTKKPKPKCKTNHPVSSGLNKVQSQQQPKKQQPDRDHKLQYTAKQQAGTGKSFSSYFDWMSDAKFLKFLSIIIGLILLIFLINVIYKRFKKPVCRVPPKPPPDDGKKSWCKRLFSRKKKKTPDEEVLIRPESKSVIAGTCGVSKFCRPTSSSSSSLGCKPRMKCMPCVKKQKCRDSKKDSTPCYSSSSRETTPDKKKSKPKVVTINEKKNTSRKDKTPKEKPPKKEKTPPKEKPKKEKKKIAKSRSTTPDSSTDTCKDELQKAGLIPKDKSNKSNFFFNRSTTSNEPSSSSRAKKSSSWDTMYSN